MSDEGYSNVRSAEPASRRLARLARLAVPIVVFSAVCAAIVLLVGISTFQEPDPPTWLGDAQLDYSNWMFLVASFAASWAVGRWYAVPVFPILVVMIGNLFLPDCSPSDGGDCSSGVWSAYAFIYSAIGAVGGLIASYSVTWIRIGRST